MSTDIKPLNSVTYFTKESEDRALKTHYGVSLMGYILKLLGRNAKYVKARASELELDTGIKYELEIEDYAKIKSVKPMGTSLAPYKACLPELRTSLLYDAIWKVQNDSIRDKLLEDIREDLYGESKYVGETIPVKVNKETEVNYQEKEDILNKYLREVINNQDSEVSTLKVKENIYLSSKPTLEHIQAKIISQLSLGGVLAGVLQRSVCDRAGCSKTRYYMALNGLGSLIVKKLSKSGSVNVVLMRMPSVETSGNEEKTMIKDMVEERIEREILEQLKQGEMLSSTLREKVTKKLDVSDPRFYASLKNLGLLVSVRQEGSKKYRCLSSGIEEKATEQPVIFKIEEVVKPTIIKSSTVNPNEYGVEVSIIGSDVVIQKSPTGRELTSVEVAPSQAQVTTYKVKQGDFQAFAHDNLEVAKGYGMCLRDRGWSAVQIFKEVVIKTSEVVEF